LLAMSRAATAVRDDPDCRRATRSGTEPTAPSPTSAPARRALAPAR
jgi:hypothetical protein